MLPGGRWQGMGGEGRRYKEGVIVLLMGGVTQKQHAGIPASPSEGPPAPPQGPHALRGPPGRRWEPKAGGEGVGRRHCHRAVFQRPPRPCARLRGPQQESSACPAVTSPQGGGSPARSDCLGEGSCSRGAAPALTFPCRASSPARRLLLSPSCSCSAPHLAAYHLLVPAHPPPPLQALPLLVTARRGCSPALARPPTLPPGPRSLSLVRRLSSCCLLANASFLPGSNNYIHSSAILFKH